MSTRISDIHAGKPDAKEDFSLHESEFTENYMIPPRFNRRKIISEDICFIVGNKGLGKTAVLRYLNQYLRRENKKLRSSFLLFEQDFTHQKKTAMVKSAQQSVITYEVAENQTLDVVSFSDEWRWHLYLAIIRDNSRGELFYKDDTWKKFERFVTGVFRDPAQISVSGGIDLSLPENLPSFFNFIQPHINIEFPEFNIGRKEYTFKQAMENADSLFPELKRLQPPYYIFIDELDVYYGDEKNYLRDLRLVYDLAIEVKRMNLLFHEVNWNTTKLFCTLRPEVIHAIDNRLPVKSLLSEIDGYSFPLSWTSDADETYTLPIMELFMKRIQQAETKNGEGGGSEEARYKRWFPQKVEGMEPYEYIRRITWARPRDIVRLITAAANKRGGETAFTENVFQALMREYSTGSLREIKQEMRVGYSQSDLDLIFDIFLNLPERFSFQDFQNKIAEDEIKIPDGKDVITILSDLYRAGAIGQVKGNRECWAYQGDLKYKKSLVNIVHRGLAFELGTLLDTVGGGVSRIGNVTDDRVENAEDKPERQHGEQGTEAKPDSDAPQAGAVTETKSGGAPQQTVTESKTKPGTAPQQAGAASEAKPGTAPEQVGATSEAKPGTTPQQAGAAPETKPGTAPQQAGAAPETKPGTAPRQAGAAPGANPAPAPQGQEVSQPAASQQSAQPASVSAQSAQPEAPAVSVWQTVFGLSDKEYQDLMESAGHQELYFESFILKTNGKTRELIRYKEDERGSYIRSLHTKVVHALQKQYRQHETSYAYHTGSSIVHCAKVHLGSEQFLKFDIHHFFNSIAPDILAAEIRKHFQITQISKDQLQAFVMCFFVDGVLPLGLVISPLLSDIYLHDLDEEMSAYAQENGCVYSRYADDILISGPVTKMKGSEMIMVGRLSAFLQTKSLKLNESKMKTVVFTQPGQYLRYVGINLVHTENGNVLTVGRSYVYEVAKDFLNYSRRKSLYARDYKEINKNTALMEDYAHYLYYEGRRLVGKIQFIRQVEGEAGIDKLLRRLSCHLHFEGEKQLIRYCIVKDLKEVENANIPLVVKQTTKPSAKSPASQGAGKGSSGKGSSGKDSAGKGSAGKDVSGNSGGKTAASQSTATRPKAGQTPPDGSSQPDFFDPDYEETIPPVRWNPSQKETGADSFLYETVGNDAEVRITQYRYNVGFSSKQTVVVPQMIDGKPVRVIGQKAFKNCNSIDAVILPRGITHIEEEAFQNSSLTQILIPDSVIRICSQAFAGCRQLRSIAIPDSVVSMEYGLFTECERLEAIRLSRNCTEIGKNTFEKCRKLKKIHIPDLVTKIEEAAFAYCDELTLVYLPASLQEMGKKAFDYCSKVQKYSIARENKYFTIIDYALYENQEKTLRYFPSGSNKKAVKIQDGTKYIDQCAFCSDKNLEQVILPDSLIQICDHAFYDNENLKDLVVSKNLKWIGLSSFEKCSSLKNLSLPASVKSIGGSAFRGCRSLEVIIIPKNVKEIKEGTFESCRSLSQVEIPEGTTELGLYSFRGCSNLHRITLPEGVKTIGWNAFAKCENLEQVSLPGSLEKIGEASFENCGKLKIVEIRDSGSGNMHIDSKAFCGCDDLEKVVLPPNVVHIGKKAFHENKILFPSPLPNVVIHGKPGSYAQKYAKHNKIPFMAVK